MVAPIVSKQEAAIKWLLYVTYIDASYGNTVLLWLLLEYVQRYLAQWWINTFPLLCASQFYLFPFFQNRISIYPPTSYKFSDILLETLFIQWYSPCECCKNPPRKCIKHRSRCFPVSSISLYAFWWNIIQGLWKKLASIKAIGNVELIKKEISIRDI